MVRNYHSSILEGVHVSATAETAAERNRNREVSDSPSLSPSEESTPFSENTDLDTCGTEEGVEKTPLGEDDLETLKRIVQEFKAHRVDFTSLPRRPKLKGPRVNTGIAINAELKRRVSERAKSDPDGTGGGNLSGLIELLLWTFLGCPKDLVDRLAGPGSDP